jgi:hypothetical protein
MIGFTVLLCLSCFIKPYILLFCGLCFGLFFFFNGRKKNRFKVPLYFTVLLALMSAASFLSVAIKGKSLAEAAREHQRLFADASKGGYFLVDSKKFIRVKDDSSLVKKTGDSLYTIAKNAPYVYWEHSHQHDTLYCRSNNDSTSVYKLVYHIPESRSNLDPALYSRGIVPALTTSLYYSLFHPFFLNAKGAVKLLASFENLLILASLIVFITGLFLRKRSSLLPMVLVFTALCVCVLTGLATPNSGAIFRYRSPVVIFILAAALYYLVPPDGDHKVNSPNS